MVSKSRKYITTKLLENIVLENIPKYAMVTTSHVDNTVVAWTKDQATVFSINDSLFEIYRKCLKIYKNSQK